MTYPQYGNGAQLQYSGGRWGTLRLAKLGSLRVRMHRPIDGAVKTLTIRRDGEQWYASFSCEVAAAPLAASATAVGIDLGLLHFATLSDGSTIENPRHLRHRLQKLKRRQQQLARCQRGSHRRNRARRQVARLHRQVRNQRADFLHQQSRRLVAQYGTIVMEDLAVANLVKRPKPRLDAAKTAAQGQPVYAPNGAAAKSGRNQSIHDAGWGMFQQYVTDKAACAGRHVLVVNPHYTSQDCSGCGHRQKMPLEERIYRCPHCGLERDRDHNAAINILRLGRSQQAGSACRSPSR